MKVSDQVYEPRICPVCGDELEINAAGSSKGQTVWFVLSCPCGYKGSIAYKEKDNG